MKIMVRVTEYAGGSHDTYSVPADSWERAREIEQEIRQEVPRGSTVLFKFEEV